MLNFFCWKNHVLGYVEFFPLKEALFFPKSASFCWNVEYVRSCWMPFPKKVLLSAEMLNMLNYFASSWSFWPPIDPKNSTYSTSQQKEAHFQTLDPTWSNIFNVSAERSTFLIPLAFFLLKCWICWIFFVNRTAPAEKQLSLFSAFFGGGGFAVSGSWGHFLRGMKKKQKFKTKQQKRKQDHKMQTRKPLSLVTKKKADNTDTKQYNLRKSTRTKS